MPPSHTQKLTVVLAFVAAALSLSAAATIFATRGEIAATPLLGGLLMLALGISGYSRLKGRK